MPSCIQDLYGYPTTLSTQPSNAISVPGFLDQYVQQADLTLFLKNFRQDLSPDTTFGYVSIDDGSDLQDPTLAGTEAVRE